MDELEISGKRYISTRRAAREHKYHSDYIGQLIRGGKVVGTKVGRAWYVDADSLSTYFGQEADLAAQHSTPAVRVAAFSGNGDKPTEQHRTIPVMQKVEAEQGQKTSAAAYIEPIIAVSRPTLSALGGLKYIPDDQPLYPEIQRTVTTSRIVANRPASGWEVNNGYSNQQSLTPQRGIWGTALLLSVLGGLALLGTIGGSAYMTAKVTATTESVAATGYSFGN